MQVHSIFASRYTCIWLCNHASHLQSARRSHKCACPLHTSVQRARCVMVACTLRKPLLLDGANWESAAEAISSERSNWSCKTPLPKSGCKSRHNAGVFRHSHRHLVPLAGCRTSTVVPLREIKFKFVTSNRLQDWTSRMHWFTDRSRGTQTTAAC